MPAGLADSRGIARNAGDYWRAVSSALQVSRLVYLSETFGEAQFGGRGRRNRFGGFGLDGIYGGGVYGGGIHGVDVPASAEAKR